MHGLVGGAVARSISSALRFAARLAVRLQVTASCALALVGCGGGGTLGGSEDTVVLNVVFAYASTQSDLRANLRVEPTLTGMAGHAPVCALSEGSLPNGMSLNSTTCVVSGTPAVAGRYSAVVVLTSDGVEGSVSAAFNLLVVDPTPTFVRAISGLSGPVSLQFNRPVPSQILVTTEASTYVQRAADVISYEIASGSLPSGIVFNSATSAVQGTPTGFGTSTVQIVGVLIRDGIAYRSASPVSVTLEVGSTSVSAMYPLQCITVPATPFTCTPTLSAGALDGVALTFTASPLPSGVVIESTTGIISGALTALGNVVVTVNLRATYPNGSAIDTPAQTTIAVGPIIPFYDVSTSNVGVAEGPGTLQLDMAFYSARLNSGQAFVMNVTGLNIAQSSDIYVYSLLPSDASTPLPSWVSIDPSSGRLFGVAPTGVTSAAWRLRLVTIRSGQAYEYQRGWFVNFAP